MLLSAIVITSEAKFAAAQDVSLNYENLSSLEEPLATEFGDVTLVLTGLFDTSLARDFENEESVDTAFIGNFQVSALTQLQNRWRVSLTYFGQYATDVMFSFLPEEKYTDNAALSVGSFWGAVLAGNVSGIVREETRRQRAAGNAVLAFDGVLGELTDWGGGYTGRFGPWVVGFIVDEDGNFDVGATFQRPMDNKDYRLTARISDAVHASTDGSRIFNTKALSGVGEVIYGSMSLDAGAGYESFSLNGSDVDRWYVSSGIRTKIGVVILSMEGHFGRFEGKDEVSAAFGLQYDLARGLSVNLGFNHAKARATLDGVELVNTKDTNAIVSFRYTY